jgi:hypothetical protein
MTIGRRGFLLAGGAVAGAGVLPVSEAMAAAPVVGGRSVTDFGVEPNKDADQSKALQAAIDEIGKTGRAIYIPGGSYRVNGLRLPPACAICGDPGRTVLRFPSDAAVLGSQENRSLHVSGLTFDGSLKQEGPSRVLPPMLFAVGGDVSLSGCAVSGKGQYITISQASGMLSAISLNGTGIVIEAPRNMRISQCSVEGYRHFGIEIEIPKGAVAGDGVLLTGNRISQCGGGIWLRGAGVVNGNIVSGASDVGIKLGGSDNENAAIMATGNNISGCNIGIGVSAGGETIFASLNLITRAKSAAIRAFDGDKLVGPDLSQKSAESYLNLTVAGNVVR